MLYKLIKPIVFLLFFVPVTFVKSQTAAQGEKFFNSGNYTSAIKVYSRLIEINPRNLLYQYRLGRSYFQLKNYVEAIEHFELSGEKYPMTPYYLGMSYFENFQFEEAASVLKEYISEMDSLESEYKQIKAKITKAEMAAPWMNRVEKLLILDSVVCSKNDLLKYYNFSSMTGKLTQKIVKNKNSYKDQISYYTQRNDRHIFSDENKGKMDIMTSFQLLNSWTDPVSISNNINTEANENYPFLMPDGATMYFASDGDGSIGGYDIFVTKYTPALKDFLKPENVGFPFNSFANDYMLVIDESKHMGWFATDRNQKQGKVVVYQFEINDKKEYINQEDSTEIVNFARLRKYYKSKMSTQNRLVVLTDTTNANVNFDWNFTINDSLEYHQKSDFKSSKASEMLDSWLKNTNSIKTYSESLKELRQKYDSLEKVGEKRELQPEIIVVEKEILKLKLFLKDLEINLRNEEIKALSH